MRQVPWSLFVAAQSGDRKARAAIHAEIEPRIVWFAAINYRKTGMDTEDLAQELRLCVERQIDSVCNIGDPLHYLVMKVRYRIADLIRYNRCRRLQSPVISIDTRSDILTSDGRPPVDRVVTETVNLNRWVARLTPMQRAVVHGLMVGKTSQQIAIELGCTGANVCYHLRRVRENYLRSCRPEDKY